jgi:hypothetical protein
MAITPSREPASAGALASTRGASRRLADVDQSSNRPSRASNTARSNARLDGEWPSGRRRKFPTSKLRSALQFAGPIAVSALTSSLTRSIDRLNDRRNSQKKQVNELTGSAIVEEKST